MTPLYHGGVRRLRAGDLILPPSITGAPCGSDYIDIGVHRRDRVYATTSVETASFFALMAPPKGLGDVYEVAPLGDDTLERDPDYRGPATEASFALPRARVVRVVARFVREWHGLTAEQALVALGAA